MKPMSRLEMIKRKKPALAIEVEAMPAPMEDKKEESDEGEDIPSKSEGADMQDQETTEETQAELEGIPDKDLLAEVKRRGLTLEG